MLSNDRREELLERAYRRGYALRRRRQFTVTVAALAMIVVAVSAVFATSRPSERRTLTVAPTTTTAPAACATAPPVVAASEVPDEVKALTDGRPVIGVTHLYTVRSALDAAAIRDADGWKLKFPWFPTPFGLPRIQGHRVDGTGTFRSEADKATVPTGDFVASSLRFSDAGCWEISAFFFDPSELLTFRLQIGDASAPRENELQRALRAFGVDLDRAPPAAVGQGDTEFCGTESADNGAARKFDEPGRRCFLTAFGARRPAAFVLRQSTVEGDPIVTVYRSKLDGTLDVFIDATRDKFGSGSWERASCRSLASNVLFPDASPPLPEYFFEYADCTDFVTASE